ncbi:hypothetical protein E3P99_02689 [Wallemia hederae]|uniref:Sulfide:quinone oxidoreductase, mitochondrial n=1 Tax=Wallemia hederae TaxID=1540922 RepID=A0A4T0FND7_9BASI|nr:hypothetical protein E3P99_02689 [Wallemia hederae]
MSVSLGKQKKRAKASQARKIDTQIPSAINVEDHVKARQFEIKALFKAIDTARTASSTRAFQSLPRHLRRRAASHNPKRVPLRLREKALAEISGDVSRLRRKRRKLLRTRMKKQQSSSSRTVNLQKRQLNKSWLETHIWHTKRMIMTNLWGYRIALHPTEKAFRPSVRAARQGCIVHDASYTSLIQIDGPQDAILRVFDSTLEKAGESASSKRYIFGTREMQSYIYEHKAYPTNIIAPVSLIWHAADGVRDKRSVWLRCHPSAFNEVHQSLHNAANELGDNALLIRDLRGHVNTFELYGPHSSQVLAGAFRLAKSNGKAQRIAWQKLSKAATPAHFPTGFVAGFNVEDPRLSFPPRNTKPDKAKAVADLTLSTTLASSLLYSEEERKKVAKPRFKKSQLDTRRSKTQQPGKALSMTPDDDTIPILVVQKRVEGGLHDSISGYTVIVPSGWGMQVWPSLTHTDARVGGIEQIEEFATQVGQTHFPASACPSSLVNYQECVRRANEEQERCNKRPKGKRPHYHSDLPLLPYLEKLREDEKEEGVKESGEKEGTAENGIKDGQLPTQPPQSQDISMDVEEETKPDAVNTNQWFLTNDLVRLVQDELKSGNSKNAQDALNGALQSLNVKKTVKLQDGLVQATMLPLKRGYARPCAYVYDDNETVGRISAATYAMNEGKAVAVVNMKAESYFDFYHSKSHLERVLTVMDNDDDTRRDYRLKVASVANITPRLVRGLATPANNNHHKILIVGGGTAGVTAAAQIQNKFRDENKSLGAGDIAIVDAAKEHHYQPGWTLIGSGLGKKEDFVRPESQVIPKDVAHIPANVQSFTPSSNTVTTATGETLTYDFLIVAAGLKINFGGVKGLESALANDTSGVSSIYNPNYAEKAWRDIAAFKSGNAIFTQPAGVIKCAGAPQKVMWMANSQWKNEGVRDKIDLTFATGTPSMFAVPKYSQALEKLRVERNVNGLFTSNLTEVDVANKVAKFAQPEGKTVEKEYDLLHVVPPQAPLDFYKNSPIADESGFVSVDKSTTQHTQYPNIFSIGDCSSLPNSKTAAAISAQAPVLVHNLRKHMEGKPLNAAYDGYASCPLLTGHGELLLAEFKYGGIPKETFAPVLGSQDKPNRLFYHLKKDIFPPVYWNYFVKGNWFGTRGPIAPNFD